jgi:hypothetical protein
MSDQDADPKKLDSQIAPARSTHAHNLEGHPTHGSRGVLLWSLALAAGIVAGGLSWKLGEQYVGYHQPSLEASEDPYAFNRLNAELSVANTKNAAIAFGILGGLLGGLLGVVGGVAKRSMPLTIVSGLVGAVLGTAAGAAPAFGVIPYHYTHFNHPELEHESYFLPLAAGVHFSMWGLLGAVSGLALALGLHGARPKMLALGFLGGFIGALIGTVVYESIGAVAMPMDRTSDPISETSTSRMVARMAVAVATALFTVLVLTRSAQHKRASERSSLS